jgi:hypothetical protein
MAGEALLPGTGATPCSMGSPAGAEEAAGATLDASAAAGLEDPGGTTGGARTGAVGASFDTSGGTWTVVVPPSRDDSMVADHFR